MNQGGPSSREAPEGTLHFHDDGSSEAQQLDAHISAVRAELPPVSRTRCDSWVDVALSDSCCALIPLGQIDSGLERMRQLRESGYKGALVFYAHSRAAPEVVRAALRGGAQDVVFPVGDETPVVARSIRHAIEREFGALPRSADEPRQWITDRFMEAQALARVGSWEVDVKTWSVEWSPEFRRIMGIGLYERPLELEGYAARAHPEDRARVTGELLGLFQQGRPFDSEHRIVHPDGAELFVHAVGRCLTGRDGSVLRAYGTTQDITERKRLELELAELSMRDDLTKLYNRRGFALLAEQQLQIAVQMGATPVLLFVDLNGMKQINDRFGHGEGDRALIATAQVLRRSLRETDIIARLGGDEFVAFVPDGSGDLADTLREQIRTALGDHTAAASHSYKLSASIGTTLYDRSRPMTVDQLLWEADTGMYEAKQRRRLHGSESMLPLPVRPDGRPPFSRK